MFIADLFTIAKIWKSLQCISVDEWIKSTVTCLHDGILLGHKKEGILPFMTTWMDLESIMLIEVSQSEKDKYCVITLTRRI